MYRILQKEILAPSISKFVLHAPFVARKRQAGNFVIVRVVETGERIPLTIVDGNTTEGTITLIVQGVGKTSNLLLKQSAGDALVDVVGPLGNPTPIHHDQTIVCIGGGVGTAELYPIAKALKDAKNKLYTIIGARSKELVILEREMAECSNELYVTTDDGSYKRKGFVTDQLKDLIASIPKIDAVYAIGPLPMMKSVSALTKEHGLKTYVSLNAIMVDGTGMCGGCRVTIDGQMKFACVDGPEFDGHAVDFDELMLRNRTYRDLELIANERFQQQNA